MASRDLSLVLETMRADLKRSIQFWVSYSHDLEHGGFFNCLTQSGDVYDETKYVWLQGRQVWMYARLCRMMPEMATDEILQAAIKGADFLMEHAKDPATGKMVFSMIRTGPATKIQRTIFAECFYALALSELSAVTADSKYWNEAIAMLDRIVYWVREDDTAVGRPRLEGATPVNNLAVPMILLGLINQMSGIDISVRTKYLDLEQWCFDQALAHVQKDGHVILENVSPEGKELPGCEGRLMNPGHAIETGWFILEYLSAHPDVNNKEIIKKKALENFIEGSFTTGWDEEFGGIFYFLDSEGVTPVQLEWNMKLWWPHAESLIAFLVAYKTTKDTKYIDLFHKVFDYTYKNFVDVDNGEWFGYLDRRGEPVSTHKGAPFKGCFHVPRCLMMCVQILEQIINEQETGV